MKTKLLSKLRNEAIKGIYDVHICKKGDDVVYMVSAGFPPHTDSFDGSFYSKDELYRGVCHNYIKEYVDSERHRMLFEEIKSKRF